MGNRVRNLRQRGRDGDYLLGLVWVQVTLIEYLFLLYTRRRGTCVLKALIWIPPAARGMNNDKKEERPTAPK